jgi:hypothetical protein
METSEILQRTAWKISEISVVLGEMTCSGAYDGYLFDGFWELGYYTLRLSVDKKGKTIANISDGPELYDENYDHDKQSEQWNKFCQVAGRLHLIGYKTKVTYG